MSKRHTMMIGSMFFTVALSLVALGCGGDAPSETPASDESARAKPAAEFLPGKWEGQIVLNDQLAHEEFDEATIDSLKSMRMTVEFAQDGSMSMAASIQTAQGPMNSESAGKWEVLEEQGETIRLRSIEEGGSEEEISLRVAGADTFEMDAPGEQKELAVMRFTRLR